MSPSKLNINKTNDMDLDLTGSPLKDDCDVHAIDNMSLDINLMSEKPIWKLEEEYHKGIAVDKARAIISSEAFQKEAAAPDGALGSVWFLCTAGDAQKTLLLQHEYLPNVFSRGIIHFMGIVPSHDVATAAAMLQSHFSVMGAGKNSSNCAVETQIENTYRIKSNIAIKCSWSTSSSKPLLIDLDTCDVTLMQTFHLGDCSSLTQDFINQLRILMTIRDDILSYKQSEGSDVSKDPIYRCGM